MRRNGLEPNQTTFSTTLTACADSINLGFGLSLHSLIHKLGFTRQPFISSGLIKVYSKCDRIEYARKVFDEMPEWDSVVWNSMISGCSQKGMNEEAFELFSGLIWGVRGWKRFVNDFILASILKACAGGGFLRFGQIVHNYAMKMGLDSNVYVGASVVDMYCKCERLDIALHVFERMGDKDVVVWNTIISGSSLNGFEEEAIQLFRQMESFGLYPNGSTLSCVLKASQVMPDSAFGRCYHVKALKLGYLSDVYVGTSVIDMYSKFLAIDYAERAFNEMIYKNVVSYNALISGYSLNGGSQDALRAYVALRMEGMKPDPSTFAALLSCSASSRSVVDGTQVFEIMRDKDIVSWSVIISGLGQYNDGKMALDMFSELHKNCGIADEFACSSVIKSAAVGTSIEPGKQLHAYVMKLGLQFQIVVGSALIYMYSKYGMVEDAYKISASIEHYTCMVNLLGRAGYLDEAELLLLDSPYSQDAQIWRSLLASCEAHQNLTVASRVAERCLELEPNVSSTYTILSNIYAAKKMWSEVSSTRNLMLNVVDRKEPGCSWIEARN
ncbi:hypothetical protein V2J09_022364 [Rumex salicifolius]